MKLIGAIFRDATRDLDRGPVTEQKVSRVENRYSQGDLVPLSRGCESRRVDSSGCEDRSLQNVSVDSGC